MSHGLQNANRGPREKIGHSVIDLYTDKVLPNITNYLTTVFDSNVTRGLYVLTSFRTSILPIFTQRSPNAT
jgi:hypothetical protein